MEASFRGEVALIQERTGRVNKLCGALKPSSNCII